MNALSPYDILTVWEEGHGRVPFEKAVLLARLARPDTSLEEIASLPVTERDLTVLELRERTLGPRLNAFAVCPACSQELEFALAISEVKERMSRPVTPLETSIGGFRFCFRRPSTSDLAGIDAATEMAASRVTLAARCIVEASRDGTAVEVRDIPKRTLSRLADYLDELEDPAEILINMNCPACAHSWQVTFDIATYFYTELTVLARRLLEEVHVLASTYGWSERDILAMPPARRQFYLERAR